MFNISSIPRGLLDLLGVRSEGRMPNTAEEIARITIDGTEFYLSSELETVAGNGTSPVAGFNSILVVPANEMWILMQANANIIGGDAGVSSVVAPSINPPGGSVLIGATQPAAALGRVFPVSNPMRVALPAGMRMGLFVDAIAGGAYTGLTTTGFTALVYRLRAGG